MIYICADDYGLIKDGDKHIEECINAAAINKVSIMAAENMKIPENALCGLHINLVEGKATGKNYKAIADENGNFKYSFMGLFIKSILPGRKKMQKEIYREISNQIKLIKKNLPDDASFCVDTHQHTHMIPLVFKTLLKVIEDEGARVSYLRIPAEPLLPYIKSASLWTTYSIPNIIKQFLLNFLWLFSKKKFKESGMKTAAFMGIMFSGKMDRERVLKVLPRYIKIAEKKKCDIEMLFHPGYTEKAIDTKFKKFYLSNGRKTEYDSVMNLKVLEEGSVF